MLAMAVVTLLKASRMKLIVKRAQFLKALQIAVRAVPTKTNTEILKNVLLTAGRDSIRLTGTDNEIGLHVDVADVVQSEPGTCLLPTSRLTSILNEMDCEEVRLEIVDGALWVAGTAFGGKSEFRLLTSDAAEYPEVPTFKDKSYFTVKASDLRRMIRRTIFACDTQSTRYALGGVQFEFGEGNLLILAATDSRRLAIDRGPFAAVGTPESDKAQVVPQRAVKLLQAICEDADGEVQVAMHPNGIAVKAGSVTMTSQFVQGRFPDWRKVLPGPPSATIDFVVGPLFGAIRQAMIMRNEESKAVDFSFSKGRLRLAADVADMGSSKVDLPVSFDGEPMAATFDPSYFADLLKVLDSSSAIQLKLISHEDPATIEENGYIYVIMPLSKDR